MGLLDSFNLDLEDPKTLGLISMAAQLIGGAPGGRKNFGADLSAGIQQGLLGYTQGKQGQMKRQAFDQDAQMRKMQMGQLERQNADQDAVRNAFSQNLQPGGPQMQPNDYETPSGPNGPSSLNMPGLQQALMRAGPAGMPHLAQLSAMQAKNYQKLGAGESLFDMSAPGGPKSVATGQNKAHFADVGGRIVPVDPITGKPIGQGLDKSVSPDTQFSGGVTMRGQNMTDARSRETNAITQQGQQTQVIETPNGPMLVNKRDSTASPVTTGGVPVKGDAQMKRETGAGNVLALLKDAKGHIDNATNSYLGAGTDIAARTVGLSTGGAESIAALKTIEGALLASMPRMEGPQSNYDVQMYKQAAGALGDPTVPAGIKRAAIDAIEKIQKRYEGAPNKASGQIKRPAYNPATGVIER